MLELTKELDLRNSKKNSWYLYLGKLTMYLPLIGEKLELKYLTREMAGTYTW